MPSFPTLLTSVCLSGCAVAGLFALAEGSARMQLEIAMASSRVPPGETKPVAGPARLKTGSLDRHRLSATIAGITMGDNE